MQVLNLKAKMTEGYSNLLFIDYLIVHTSKNFLISRLMPSTETRSSAS
ncbi:MAG: hypothetical protein UR50_C0015G0008 [Parcubacteria group bacterium GW2011_GWC1_34_10]|nr:MAG: hypothetical protein UR50_C0015G0008 [Parcubacteria group bacterium GW2011_GWC1_34_10]